MIDGQLAPELQSKQSSHDCPIDALHIVTIVNEVDVIIPKRKQFCPAQQSCFCLEQLGQ